MQAIPPVVVLIVILGMIPILIGAIVGGIIAFVWHFVLPADPKKRRAAFFEMALIKYLTR
jgi:hypothetical protein